MLAMDSPVAPAAAPSRPGDEAMTTETSNAYLPSPTRPTRSRVVETATQRGSGLLARRRTQTVAEPADGGRGSPEASAADLATPFESLLPGIEMVHFNNGEPPFAVKLVAFNRDPKTNRTKYTVRVRFEHQTWLVFKYYTDFLRLRNSLEHSQFFEIASDLPPKHPLRLRLRMKMSISKRRAFRKEMAFIKYRMQRLEMWLNRVLQVAGPGGVQHVQFLNDFFGAFPDDEPYNRAAPRRVHAKIGTSMYHGLRSMAVPARVYDRLWGAGYCFESLGSMSVEQWREFGVSPVLAATLFAKFHRKPQAVPIPGAAAAALRRSNGALRERAFSDAAAMAVVADASPPPYMEKQLSRSAPGAFSTDSSAPAPSAPPASQVAMPRAAATVTVDGAEKVVHHDAVVHHLVARCNSRTNC